MEILAWTTGAFALAFALAFAAFALAFTLAFGLAGLIGHELASSWTWAFLCAVALAFATWAPGTSGIKIRRART